MSFAKRLKSYSEDVLAALGIDLSLVERLKRMRNSIIFREKAQFEFIEDFKSWLDDNGNIRKACTNIINSAEAINEGKKPYVQVAKDIREAVVNGRSVASGMEDWFDPAIVMVFTVGQETSNLSEMLNNYIKQREEIKEARSEFLKPLKYPFVMMLVSIAMAMGLSQIMLPQFIPFVPVDQWPDETKLFLNVTNHFASYFALYIMVLIVFFCLFNWWLVNGRGRVRRSVSNLFPFNIYSYLLAMQLTKMMSLLVGRVFSPYQAAKEIRKSASPFFAWHLKEIMNREETGSVSIAHSFDTGLLPARLIQRMDAACSQGGAKSQLLALETAGKRSGYEAIATIGRTKVYVLLGVWVFNLVLLLWSIQSFFNVFVIITDAQ